jgi:hypothetical protein
MYGIDELSPAVKKHFNLTTFGLDPLKWLYKILGNAVVDEHYRKFWSAPQGDYGDEALLQYLNGVFNPLLNRKLKRPEETPTFRDMLEHAYTSYVMKDPMLSKHVKEEFLLKQVKKREKQRAAKL